ncbi:hypothetical protein NEFER03_0314 [Nematocida sp. LUAm3]|nr:hypothetical protein NEFER03_0314 [Nematocida sp. LUAm3]KAI5173766.1 hypothetical protein NEFER02_0282 [Nematocida sp. LUAm2]KAI5176989.1 hypothetical protein NEFER01_0314 [Nematocida sp. LUAm1]
MEFSSTEDERVEEKEEREEETEGSELLLVAICCFYIQKTLKRLGTHIFEEKQHASPYNLYMREKEKVKGNPEESLELFVSLAKKGVLCRIVYSISTGHPFKVETSLEILSGRQVISEKERKIFCIAITIDSKGNFFHHSLYLSKRLFKAFEGIWGYRRDPDEFLEYDKKLQEQLPLTKKEAVLHPLYTIERQFKRSIIYPKAVGWIGALQRTKDSSSKTLSAKDALKSSAQLERESRIYPISHLVPLLSISEIYRRNMRVEKGSLPYKVLPATQAHPEGIRLYAPWQLHALPKREDSILTSSEIPEDSVFLLETECISYRGLEDLGTLPHIGERYNHFIKRSEHIYNGLLIKKSVFREQKDRIKAEIVNNLIENLLSRKKALFLNIRIFSKEVLTYLDMLDSLKNP